MELMRGSLNSDEFHIPEIRKSKKAARAVKELHAFFADHAFAEDEQGAFFCAAMFCAVSGLDGRQAPVSELNEIADLCEGRMMTAQDIGQQIEGCKDIVKAMTGQES